MKKNLVEAIQKIGMPGPEVPTAGLKTLEEILPDLKEEDHPQTIEALLGLYYIDIYERPDLKPLYTKAQELILSLGDVAMPYLIEALNNADLKFSVHVGTTLGKMGDKVVDSLLDAFQDCEDPTFCSVIVFALGKVKSPGVARSLPMLVAAASHESREVRDSAVRSIGKISEIIPLSEVPKEDLDRVYDVLLECLGDKAAPIRSKSVRSLGKMAIRNFFGVEQLKELKSRLHRILGHDESFNWDNAFIVRKEAELALKNLGE